MTNNRQPTTNKQHLNTQTNKQTNNQANTQQNNNKARQVCVTFFGGDLLLKPSGRHVVAWRPRTRCTVEAPSAPSSDALAARAAYEHHAAPRGHMKARSGEWERPVLHGHVPEHPTPQAAGTVYFAMDVDDVLAASGSRPDRLTPVSGPQEPVQQHPVDQIVDTAPALPILDVPVPLMGEQLVDVLRFFDTLCPVAGQVIDVPKIILEDIPARRLCREPQLVEQLVDEPVPSFDDFDLVEEEEGEVPGFRVRDAHGRSWCRVAGPAGYTGG